MGIPLDLERHRSTSDTQLQVGRQLLDHVHTPKTHLEHMLRDLIQEGREVGFGTKAGELYGGRVLVDSEEKSDLSIDTKSGRHRFPL